MIGLLAILLVIVFLCSISSGQDDTSCASSVLLSSAISAGLGSSAPEVAARFALGMYKLVQPGVYQHYDGERFLRRDNSDQWVYSSQRDGGDNNQIQSETTSAMCPEDPSVRWRFNTKDTTDRWKYNNAFFDSTFKVKVYVDLEESNHELLREVREALSLHTEAISIIEKTNSILENNQKTNNKLLDLFRTNMESSSAGQVETNTILAKLVEAFAEVQKTSGLTNTLLEENKENTETTNSLLEELKTHAESFKQKRPFVPLNVKDFLKSMKGNESEGERGSLYDLRKPEEVTPDQGFGLIRLGKDYNKKHPQPGGTKVFLELQPKSISEINSMEKTVGLEIHLKLVWEDDRIEWTHPLSCGDVLSFSPTILK